MVHSHSMILFFLILIFLALLFSIPMVNQEALNNGSYISRKRTSLINGCMILLIILWHVSPKTNDTILPTSSLLAKFFFPLIGQCVTVGPFLFFSGYGLYASFQKKGNSYLNKLLFERFPRLLLSFDIIVLLYCLIHILHGGEFDGSHFVLALLAWDSYGNISWYVFVILSCYLMFAVFFKRLTPKKAIYALTLAVCALVYILQFSGKPDPWYSTPLCFPAGVLFGWKKQWIEKHVLQCLKHRLLLGGIVCLIAIFAYHIPDVTACFKLFTKNISSVAFCGGLVLINSTISFLRPNRFLIWCGSTGVFALLLFHKIPENELIQIPLFTRYGELYTLVYVALTLIGAYATIFVWQYTINPLLKLINSKLGI